MSGGIRRISSLGVYLLLQHMRQRLLGAQVLRMLMNSILINIGLKNQAMLNKVFMVSKQSWCPSRHGF